MDSRQREQTPVTETEKAKTLYVRQEFGFFSRSVSPENSEIMDTADIANTISQVPAGALIGRARTLDGRSITGDNQLRITFEIQSIMETEKNAFQASTTEEHHFDTLGSPLDKPVITMDTPQGFYVSLGQLQTEENKKTFQFNNWVKILKSHQHINKKALEVLIRKHAAQPRSLKLSELKVSKFKII